MSESVFLPCGLPPFSFAMGMAATAENVLWFEVDGKRVGEWDFRTTPATLRGDADASARSFCKAVLTMLPQLGGNEALRRLRALATAAKMLREGYAALEPMTEVDEQFWTELEHQEVLAFATLSVARQSDSRPAPEPAATAFDSPATDLTQGGGGDCLTFSEGAERDREQVLHDAAAKAHAWHPLTGQESASLDRRITEL